MAEESKFTGALAKLKQPATNTITEEPEIQLVPVAAEPLKPVGRPPGKRSDPEYQPTTVLLRKQTKRKAARLLEDEDTGQDLSELIEELLRQWIEQHS